MLGKRVVKNKHFLLWTVLILFSFISACVLTSLGKNLFETDKYPAAEGRSRNFIIGDPVFHPLTQSGLLSNLRFSPGTRVIYSGDATSTPGIA